jgi:hypothetical protein
MRDKDIQKAIESGWQRQPVMLRKYLEQDKIWLKKKSIFVDKVFLYQKV